MLEASKFLVGVTVGSGAVAAIATRGGADFLLAINAARLRNMGTPSISCMLPLADAAAQVEDYAVSEVLPLDTKPVFAGLTCWRAAFDAAGETKRLLEKGFSGIVNFPPSALYPTEIQRNLERAGLGFSAEIDMLVAAQSRGALALAYCYSISQCRQAAISGVQHILLNLGWNTGGMTSPSSSLSLDEAATLAVSAANQIRRINPEALFLLEGGPIETAEDLAFVRSHAKLDGYVGGSTFERLPIERAITDRIATFKSADRVRQREDRQERRIVSAAEDVGLVAQSAAMRLALGQMFEAARRGQPLTYISVPEGDSFAPFERFVMAQTASVASWLELDAKTLDDMARLNDHLDGSAYQAPRRRMGIILRSVDQIDLKNAPMVSDRLLDLQRDHGERHPVCFAFSRLPADDLPDGVAETPFGALCRANQISVPGLHERADDIPSLIDQMLANSPFKNRASHLFSPGAMRRLQGHAWRGNAAELIEVCARLKPAMAKGLVASEQVEVALSQPATTHMTATSAAREERQFLIAALAQNRFRKGQTADALGISRKTLYNRMKRHGLS